MDTGDTYDQSFIDDALWRFEEAWKTFLATAKNSMAPPDLKCYIPSADHPGRQRALAELIKIDMEYRWRCNQSKDVARNKLEDYQEWCELNDDQDIVFGTRSSGMPDKGSSC